MAKPKTSSGANSNKMARWTIPYLVCVVVFLFLVGVAVSLWVWRYDATAQCTTNNLQLIPGQQNGAAGTIYQNMALKNTGKATCTLGGFPTAFLYGNDGYALGSAAASRPEPAPVSIALEPGETVHTTLGYPQAGNFDPGVCSSKKSTTLKLYVPGATTPLETPVGVAWCPGFSATSLQPGS